MHAQKQESHAFDFSRHRGWPHAAAAATTSAFSPSVAI